MWGFKNESVSNLSRAFDCVTQSFTVHNEVNVAAYVIFSIAFFVCLCIYTE